MCFVSRNEAHACNNATFHLSEVHCRHVLWLNEYLLEIRYVNVAIVTVRLDKSFRHTIDVNAVSVYVRRAGYTFDVVVYVCTIHCRLSVTVGGSALCHIMFFLVLL